MKISKSKRQLAQLLIEAGVKKFPRGANWVVQDKCDLAAVFSGQAPTFNKGRGMHFCNASRVKQVVLSKLTANWHQTKLSRAEFDHVVAETALDTDGWIEWGGGDCPVDVDVLVCCKWRSGKLSITAYRAGSLSWRHNGNAADIIAYRLHKPEQSKPEFCESVMRSIPEPEAKPTIEQLASYYRNAKDYAERKQQEADAAKADADAKLKALELAGEAIGLLVSPIAEKQKSELVIAVQVGDEVECVESNIKRDKYNGMVGRMHFIDESDTSTPYLVDFGGAEKIWCHEVKFIRRP